MTAAERKRVQGMWRRLAKVIGPGRRVPQKELDARWHEVMDR